MTSAELLDQYQSAMGNDLGFIFHSLEKTHIWNKRVFTQFKELYSVLQTRVDLMNRCAPEFFHMLSYVFLDSIVLGTIKLFDPASTKNGKEQNISFYKLAELLGDDQFILEKVIDLKPQLDLLKKRRDKQIAHMDELTHKNLDYVNINIKMISEVHHIEEQILNKLRKQYLKAEILYNPPKTESMYISILKHLQNSLRYKKHLFSLAENGQEVNWNPDDEISKIYRID